MNVTPLAAYVLTGFLRGHGVRGLRATRSRKRDFELAALRPGCPSPGHHSLIDHLIPILAGSLIGLSVYHLSPARTLFVCGRRRAPAVRGSPAHSLAEGGAVDPGGVGMSAAAVLHEPRQSAPCILGLLLDEYRAWRGRREPQRAELVERSGTPQRRRAHLVILDALTPPGCKPAARPEGERVALDRLIAALAADVSALATGFDGVVVIAECGSRGRGQRRRRLRAHDPREFAGCNSPHSLLESRSRWALGAFSFSTQAGRAIAVERGWPMGRRSKPMCEGPCSDSAAARRRARVSASACRSPVLWRARCRVSFRWKVATRKAFRYLELPLRSSA